MSIGEGNGSFMVDYLGVFIGKFIQPLGYKIKVLVQNMLG